MSDDHLRLADTERDQAAAALGEHFAQGRLSADEHAERLDRIWAARTRGELAPVFADLPADRPARITAHRERRTPRRLLLPILVVLIVLSAITHAPWVILFGAVLLFVGLRRRARSGPFRTG